MTTLPPDQVSSVQGAPGPAGGLLLSADDREALCYLQLRYGTAALVAVLEDLERLGANVAKETNLNRAADHLHVAAALKVAYATAAGAESKRREAEGG